MISDLKLIEKVKEKLDLSSWASLERHFDMPKNSVNNVRYGSRKLPKKYRHKMTVVLFEPEKPNLDNWNISAKRLEKWKFPTFIQRIMEYCKDRNIKTSELIETHRRVHPKPH